VASHVNSLHPGPRRPHWHGGGHAPARRDLEEEHRGRHAPYGGAAQAHRHISEQAETRCGLAGVAALCIAKDVSFP